MLAVPSDESKWMVMFVVLAERRSEIVAVGGSPVLALSCWALAGVAVSAFLLYSTLEGGRSAVVGRLRCALRHCVETGALVTAGSLG